MTERTKYFKLETQTSALNIKTNATDEIWNETADSRGNKSEIHPIHSDSEAMFLWHLAICCFHFFSHRLFQTLDLQKVLLKTLEKKHLRSHWCNKVKGDQRAASHIKRVISMTLVGLRSATPASPHERTAGKCIWHANSVITTLVGARVLNWFETGNTSFARWLCGRRHPSCVDGDDALFCFAVLENTQTPKRASSARHTSEDTFNWGMPDNGLWTVIKLFSCWVWTLLMCFF